MTHPHRLLPADQTLEDFDLEHLPSLRRDVLAHLTTGTFVPKAENVILLGPPGIGKTHLAIGLGVKAAHGGYSALFDTASNWIGRLSAAHHANRLEAELKKIRRYKLIAGSTDATHRSDHLVAAQSNIGRHRVALVAGFLLVQMISYDNCTDHAHGRAEYARC